MTTFNKAWADALLNNSDSSKRFFPLPNDGGIRNVTDERGEPVFQTYDDGSKAEIKQGTRAFTGLITGQAATPRVVNMIESFKCKSIGFYKIDRGGNWIGVLSTSTGNCDVCDCNAGYTNTGYGCSTIMRDAYTLIAAPLYANDGTRNGILLDSGAYLYPIAIDSGSLYAFLQPNNAKDRVTQVMFGFDFAQNERDQSLSMIPCSSFTDFSPLTLKGLIDVCPVFSGIETTGLTVELQTKDGDAVNITNAQGLVAADFTITNETDSGSSVGFTGTGGSFTESSPGVYDIVFDTADQPALGDVLKMVVSKNGYDFTCVANTTIQVPNS